MSLSRVQSPPQPVHHPWVDLVRVLAVFQVALVHLSFPIFFKGDLPPSAWAAANFYDSLSRMGVPLFFMVSGALLLPKTEPLGVFFRKRFLKVGLPTLFWTTAYLLWSVEAYRDGSMPALRVALSMLKAVYLGDIEIHLWFLYVLVGLYLVTPLLRRLVSAAARPELAYFLLLWLLGAPLVELGKRLTGYQTAFQIPLVTGYVGYFILGFWLADIRLAARGRWLALVGLLLAVAVTYFGTALLSSRTETIDAFLYSYFSLPTVLASACAFLLLKDLGQRLDGRPQAALRALSATSFGVYLVHILVIDLLRSGALGLRLYSWMVAPLVCIPALALLVCCLSALVVALLQRIPVFKWLVP